LYPEGEDPDKRRLGSHAKFCIPDWDSAYIGSANLTSPGLGENVEIGVMVRGEVARQLERFWQYAVDIGLCIPYEP
jgi:phosphatidylserine/phosphatidylglycerophosphate/cardiolipin synthase-like enzyme